MQKESHRYAGGESVPAEQEDGDLVYLEHVEVSIEKSS